MSKKQRTPSRTTDALADAWERRTSFVRNEQAAASAANDAKTARLRALRLEKEKQEAADIRQTEESAPVRVPTRIKRVVV
jgi:hypothetical protein